MPNGTEVVQKKDLISYLVQALSVGAVMWMVSSVQSIDVMQNDIRNLKSNVEKRSAGTEKLRLAVTDHDLRLQALELQMNFYHRRGGAAPNE